MIQPAQTPCDTANEVNAQNPALQRELEEINQRIAEAASLGLYSVEMNPPVDLSHSLVGVLWQAGYKLGPTDDGYINIQWLPV